MRTLGRAWAIVWVSFFAGPLLAGIAATTSIEDLAVDFGEGGLWARFNDGEWTSLATLDADQAATGDLDASGNAELVVDFGASGLWILYDGESWIQLHTLDAEFIAVGDLDGGPEDLVVDFGEFGIWVWSDNSSWSMLHPASPEEFALGDLDIGDNDVLAVDFGTIYGLWVYGSSFGWLQLTELSPEGIEILETSPVSSPAPPADAIPHPGPAGTNVFPSGNGSSCDMCGIVADFGASGIWVPLISVPTVDWFQLLPLDALGFGTGDFDGDGAQDLVVAFTGSDGTWVLSPAEGWFAIHPLPVLVQDSARLDGGSLDEGVFGFGDGLGAWVLRNAATYYSLHPLTPDFIVSGELDGELVTAPVVTLTKTPDLRGIVGTGGTVTFTFGIGNAGQESFTIGQVVDSDFDDVCPEVSGAVLGPSQSTECVFVTGLEGDSSTPHTNTAVVEVTGSGSGRTAAASANAVVIFSDNVVAQFVPDECPTFPSVHLATGPSKGAFFSIDVMVEQIADLFGVAFTLLYDPTSAQFLGSSSDKSIFTAPGTDTVILAQESQPGQVAAVATLLGRGYCSTTGLGCDEDEDCDGETCLASLGESSSGFVMRLVFQATALSSAGDEISFGVGNREITICTEPATTCTDVQGETDWCGGTLFVNSSPN